MRNLLGRLEGRSLDEIVSISRAWQVPPIAFERGGLIGAIYGAMRDPRAVRDFWQRLSQPERDLISLLVVAEQSPETTLSLEEIARALDADAQTARETAVSLYQKGVVAREGDTRELPVGVEPQLFVPRELANAFERLFDEIAAGDISQDSLPELLARLDLADLEDAAAAWGYNVLPGLRGAEELTSNIVKQMETTGKREGLVDQLPRLERLIWDLLADDQSKDKFPYQHLELAARLNTTNIDDADQLRRALAALEKSILVCHAWSASGERWVFIPCALRRLGESFTQETLSPALAEQVDALQGPRHSEALAWDLLTFLRAIDDPERTPVRGLQYLSNRWKRTLNEQLWNRGAALPPNGYIELLVALASEAGLIGGQADQPPFKVNPEIRNWRSRSFPDESAHLAWWWLASSDWIEGVDVSDIIVRGAAWPLFRRKLLAGLATLERGSWYEIETLANWIATRDPEMLGPTAVAATARAFETGGDEFGRRRAAVIAASIHTLQGVARWFGIVEHGSDEAGLQYVRVTERVAALLENREPEAPATVASLSIGDDGELIVENANPLLAWSLPAFAELQVLGEVSRYRLTERSVRRASAARHSARQISDFLGNQSGSRLPRQLVQQIEAWLQSYRIVDLRLGVRMLTGNPAQLAEIEERLQREGWRSWRDSDGLWTEMPLDENEEAWQRLTELLEAMGFHLQAHTDPPYRIDAVSHDPEI